MMERAMRNPQFDPSRYHFANFNVVLGLRDKLARRFDISI
jgi:hypothetical protein